MYSDMIQTAELAWVEQDGFAQGRQDILGEKEEPSKPQILGQVAFLGWA